MSISLAIMVRDDAERLRRAIRSLAGAVDHVLVLDTGSKDDTVEVAKAEGARVEQIEWPNSFSKGLNCLLDLVRTDWILRLDSDEWFETDMKGPLEECMAHEYAAAFTLTRRDIQPGGGYEEIALVRLWRNHPSLRYAGIVHENIPLDAFRQAWPGRQVVESPWWFWHDGYGLGNLDKIRRNIPLLEQELEEHPGNPYYEALLAKGYKDVGDSRWQPMMNQIVGRSLEQVAPSTPILTAVYADVLDSIQGADLRDPQTDKIVERALEWFGSVPGVVVAVANLELRRSNKPGALRALLIIEEMANTGEYSRSMPVNPAIFGKPFWKLLDQIADQLGRWEICQRCTPHL